MTSRRHAVRPDEASTPRVAWEDGIWRLRSLDAARQLLRARGKTTQAGFTSEKIPQGYLRHHPILLSDGDLHDEQRRKVGRFFAARTVERRYLDLMERCADERLDAAQAAGTCRLDDLALHYSVEVTAEVVGLTESSIPKMSRRLVSFFNQPPVDMSRDDLGRTGRQWAKAALNGLVPIVRFYLADVRPALRAHRREKRQDVIGHLLEEGYTDVDVLVECVTYGTAGMVTTREFIAMAAWHLLHDDALACRFARAERPERLAILAEIIRLEPVVGHLYRRVREDVTVTDGEAEFTIAAGDLVDVCVRATNTDPHAVGEDALDLCPARDLPRGVDATALTFGDGAHRCPGQPLALLEADVLLTRLLARRPRITREPDLDWDDLIEGYRLRGFDVELTRD